MTKNIFINKLFRSALEPHHKNNYKKLINFILNASERFLGKKSLNSLPLGIDLISTTRCNFNCAYCKKFDWGEVSELSLEKFNSIADYFFPTLTYIKFGSAGEHLLHKDLPHMLRRCHSDGVEVIINSNGSLLTRKMIETLLNNRVAVFGLSLDGAEKETAERIRKGLNFDSLMENLRELNRQKSIMNLKRPILTVNFAAMKRNIEELPDFIHLMADAGVELIRIMYLYIHDFMDPNESLFLHRPLMHRSISLAIKEAQKRGVKMVVPPDLDGSYKLKKCYYPYHEIGISPEGSVAFCCNAWDEMKMGNVFKQDFRREIWNSEIYRNLRKTVNSQSPVFELCQECAALDRGATGLSRHFSKKHHSYARSQIGSGSPGITPVPA